MTASFNVEVTMSSRFTIRENALIIIYIHLLREGKDVQEIINDLENPSDGFIERHLLDDEMTAVVKHACKTKEVYALAMDQYLTHWRFDRLGFIEQACLILASAELEFGEQEKSIIVNEAVRMVKIYGEDDSFRIINGVLDAL